MHIPKIGIKVIKIRQEKMVRIFCALIMWSLFLINEITRLFYTIMGPRVTQVLFSTDSKDITHRTLIKDCDSGQNMALAPILVPGYNVALAPCSRIFRSLCKANWPSFKNYFRSNLDEKYRFQSIP